MAADDSGTKTAGQAWWATVLTIFPELLPGPLAASLSGKALARGIWRLDVVDIRARATGRHASVDDQPFGGGPGMVMRPDVVDAALRAALAPGQGDGDGGEDGGEDGGGTGVESIDQDRPIIYLSPRGRRLDQSLVRHLAAGPGPVLICGRYEGVDQRVLDAWSVEEISLGDFVLSGGEIAATALLDACVRLLPGVVGAEASLKEESFEQGLLEYPHYTRPDCWRDGSGKDRMVPEILTSGHHGRIAAWRRDQAEAVTKARRPDLWAQYTKRRKPGAAEQD